MAILRLARHGERRGLRTVWWLFVATVVPARAMAQDAPVSEYRVKAAYLLNFARYVVWPPGTFESPDQPLRLCVLGSDPFGDALPETVSGRTANGRRIELGRVEGPAQARECHLVFISRAEWRRRPDVLAALQAPGVLTVGEGDDFAEAGGVLGFVQVDRSMRFAVNLEASDLARLRISSRMLALAAQLHGRPGGRGP